MLTKKIKMKQLTVNSQKLSSNNDISLIEQHYHAAVSDVQYSFYAIPQFHEFLFQGAFYAKTKACNQLTFSSNEFDDLSIQLQNDVHKMNPHSLDHVDLQPAKIIDWVRQFRSKQLLYQQTGATYSTGVVLTNGDVHMIECSSFETSLYKLLGSLIRKEHAYYPIFLFSHALNMSQKDLIMMLSPNVILAQSSITAPLIESFKSDGVTTFAYCRKSKYNRYTNFHM